MLRLSIAAVLFLAFSPASWSQSFDGKDEIHVRDLLNQPSFYLTTDVQYKGAFTAFGKYAGGQMEEYSRDLFNEVWEYVIWQANYFLPRYDPDPAFREQQVPMIIKIPGSNEFEKRRNLTALNEWLDEQGTAPQEGPVSYFIEADRPRFDFDQNAFVFTAAPYAFGENLNSVPFDSLPEITWYLNQASNDRFRFQLMQESEVLLERQDWLVKTEMDPELVTRKLQNGSRMKILIEGQKSGAMARKVSSSSSRVYGQVAVDAGQVSLWLYDRSAAKFERLTSPMPLSAAVPELSTVSVENPEFLEKHRYVSPSGE